MFCVTYAFSVAKSKNNLHDHDPSFSLKERDGMCQCQPSARKLPEQATIGQFVFTSDWLRKVA